MSDPSEEKAEARSAGRLALLLALLAIVLVLWETVDPPPQERPPPERVAHRTTPLPSARRAAVPIPEVPIPAIAPLPIVLESKPGIVADPRGLRLTEIVSDAEDPALRFAVIDDLAVRVGEKIKGNPVREILPDRVLVGQRGEVVLTLTGKER